MTVATDEFPQISGAAHGPGHGTPNQDPSRQPAEPISRSHGLQQCCWGQQRPPTRLRGTQTNSSHTEHHSAQWSILTPCTPFELPSCLDWDGVQGVVVWSIREHRVLQATSWVYPWTLTPRLATISIFLFVINLMHNEFNHKIILIYQMIILVMYEKK